MPLPQRLLWIVFYGLVPRAAGVSSLQGRVSFWTLADSICSEHRRGVHLGLNANNRCGKPGICWQEHLLFYNLPTFRKVEQVASLCVSKEGIRIRVVFIGVVGHLRHGPLLLFAWRDHEDEGKAGARERGMQSIRREVAREVALLEVEACRLRPYNCLMKDRPYTEWLGS
ncbi:hypothetical protein EYF80_046279 [Liparis tanakae]|uniref:Uncharacterized protein n=1 Tax=Liparis tanakae TaxID=230148 RepID=A0A4Z2FRH6_9TELE|nr:hypothetical protein EYF80_046279 [Liparis tanakae]